MNKNRPDIPPVNDNSGDEPRMDAGGSSSEVEVKAKKHLIKCTWLRRTLKTLMWVLIALIFLPIIVVGLLYVQPVQNFVKDVACDYVYKSTGMKVEVGHLHLGFPLNINLENVTVLDQHADTMVNAGNVVADVKLRPLLSLDVRLNKLNLRDAYYRMVSPDSSMVLSVRAGLLEVDDKSSANISTSEINLHKALVKDGDLKLYMNVWKQKPTPTDTTSTPFLIKADDLRLENFSFAMSMLPVIDTLYMNAADVALKKGVVDLRSNKITASLMSVNKGDFTYLVPTPEYVKTHPAPVDTVSTPSAPIQILADSISLDGFNVLYATKGVKPLPGFDASYISLSEVGVGMKDFFNEASTVNLPVSRITAKERSGLYITRGNGFVGVDSTGLSLRGLNVSTPYSQLSATAGIPFALMELKPEAPVNALLNGTVGIPDIEAFMPSLKTYTAMLPNRNPLVAALEADGTLADLSIDRLEASIRGFINLKANGTARNPLDMKKLQADVDFDGEVENTSIIARMLKGTGIHVPTFRLAGNAAADRGTYSADIALHTPEGSVAALGHVALDAERYQAHVNSHGLDVGQFMPALGIGRVYADLNAEGAGFNPVKPAARTRAEINLSSITYQKSEIKDIYALATLGDGAYTLTARTDNPNLNVNFDAEGTIAPDLYTFDVRAHVNNANLYALGLSPQENAGRADIYLNGSASPEKWLYSADMKVSGFEWTIANKFYRITEPVMGHFIATQDNVKAHFDAVGTNLDFIGDGGLKNLVAGFTAAADSATIQMGKREIDFNVLRKCMPSFKLDLAASGRGLVGQFLANSGMSVDTIGLTLLNDSIIHGGAYVRSLNTGSMTLDTITLGLHQRGQLLDYKAHLGNRKGNLNELADVNIDGYVGSNRALASLTQKNIAGETGYRLGFTVAMMDSSVNLHFTPLKATIAYLPWQINLDNHLEYYFNGRIDANLKATSRESSIALLTTPGPSGNDELHVGLENIRIEDFMSMVVDAPPVTGIINTDLKVGYVGTGFEGGGSMSVHNLCYDKTNVGDFDLDLNAMLDNSGATDAGATLKIDGADALAANVKLQPDSVDGKLSPKELGVKLIHFPLSVANPFLGPEMAVLSGGLSGEMDMSGTFAAPLFNGNIVCDSVGVYIPMSGTRLKFDNEPLVVDNNVLRFNNYDIWAMNKNPLTINGSINARQFSDVSFDVSANASNIQLVNNDSRSHSDIYGKLFMNLAASVRGPMKHFTVNANATVLSATNIYYTLAMMNSQVGVTDADDVVKFVVFSDTTQTAAADSVPRQMSMRLIAALTLEPGMQATVNLGSNGTDKVQLEPSGSLNYYQNFMGDMRLTGTLNTGNGFARYSVPAIGQKMMTFEPQSNVVWAGDIMNPTINVSAYDKIRSNVVENGNSRLVDFVVSMSVGGNLSHPTLNFDLKADNDLSIENQLQSMSADQRSQQAMSLFLYGQYTANGVKTNSGPATGMLYSYLTGQLNSWAAQNIRAVDISFGVDQYDKMVNGDNSTTTSYSYKVSKSLFNNRFKISVGGNYTTDASADENFSENLISDISFEYILKQTQNMTMYGRIFRHTGYESILEGEITETGVGFVLRRRLATLRHLFRFGKGKREREDSIAAPVKETARKENTDSLKSESDTINKDN